jgi:hypothetical protein
MLLATAAFARDDGRYANSPLKQWFESLKSQFGQCRKFSNPAGRAGVRKLPAATNSAPREHKTFDSLNFLCV